MADRSDFGRVAAVAAVLALLPENEHLDDVQISYAWQGAGARDECIYVASIEGDITQGPMRSGSTIDDDKFVITFAIEATRTAGQIADIDAAIRCEQMMSGVREVISENARPAVAGLFQLTNDGADGPVPVPVSDPAGWTSYGSVRVGAWVRMQKEFA